MLARVAGATGRSVRWPLGALLVSSTMERTSEPSCSGASTSARTAVGGGGPREGSRGGRRPLAGCCSASLVSCCLRCVLSGALPWCWTQAACVLELNGPMRLPARRRGARDVAPAGARAAGLRRPSAFPTRAERRLRPARGRMGSSGVACSCS